MNMYDNFRGVFPALITPFDTKGNINCAALEEIVEWHLACEVNGFYVCGTTGEGLLLTNEERNMVARTVIKAASGRVTVIVHVGALSTKNAVELAKSAEDMGADAISTVPPILFGVGDQKCLIGHYERIAEASQLPLLAYYLPTFMGELSMIEIKHILDIDNVLGVKFSSYDLFQMRRIVEKFTNKVVFSGNDEVFFPALTMGAWGSIGLTLNFMPQIYVAIYKAFQSKNMAEGMRLQGFANKIIGIIFDIYSPAAAKAILNHIGFNVGIPRRPLRPFEEGEQLEFIKRIKDTNLFQMIEKK